MSALPVRRLATTALCASLLIGAAAPALAADTVAAPARSTFVTSGLAAADPAPPEGGLATLLAPVTGLLGGLLGGAQPAPQAAEPAKPAPQAAAPAPQAAEPAPLAAEPAEPAEQSPQLKPLDAQAQEQTTAIEKALPKNATADQSEAMAGLRDAINEYVKASVTGDTADASTDLRSAVSDLVESITSQWLDGAQKP
ncbi:hypothetical protein [Streptomyces sp. NPDC016845]|uniref:hypothetical protein n=1 Tax=Streptomyces sp. NPDC016845 TaxID=3364972 RepID=UPI003787EEE4